MLGGEHQHEGGSVAEAQKVSSSEEDAKVRASTIHICEHRAQAGQEADPAPPAEHAGVGAQGLAEEARGSGGIQTLSVGGLRFLLTLGELMLFAAGAVRGGEQGPAVGGDLQGGTQGGQGGVWGPRSRGSSSLSRGDWKHGCWSGLLALASSFLERDRVCVVQWIVASRNHEPGLYLEELSEEPMYAWKPEITGPACLKWVPEQIGSGSQNPRRMS